MILFQRARTVHDVNVYQPLVDWPNYHDFDEDESDSTNLADGWDKEAVEHTPALSSTDLLAEENLTEWMIRGPQTTEWLCQHVEDGRVVGVSLGGLGGVLSDDDSGPSVPGAAGQGSLSLEDGSLDGQEGQALDAPRVLPHDELANAFDCVGAEVSITKDEHKATGRTPTVDQRRAEAQHHAGVQLGAEAAQRAEAQCQAEARRQADATQRAETQRQAEAQRQAEPAPLSARAMQARIAHRRRVCALDLLPGPPGAWPPSQGPRPAGSLPAQIGLDPEVAQVEAIGRSTSSEPAPAAAQRPEAAAPSDPVEASPDADQGKDKKGKKGNQPTEPGAPEEP